MISDVLLATERLRTEKKYLSNMIIKLIGENQQLLRENKHIKDEIRRVFSPQLSSDTSNELSWKKSTWEGEPGRSLQYPQSHARRMSGDIEIEDRIKIKKPKEIKHYQDEMRIPRLCNCHLHRHQEFVQTDPICHRMPSCDSTTLSNSIQCHYLSGPCLEHESARNTKTHLQNWEKKVEEKKGDIFKEQMQMLETRAALIEQGKHIESLQMKINHLQGELKISELRAALQTEELKKDYYNTWMYEINMDHLGSQMNRGSKRSYVYVWQASADRRPEVSRASSEFKRPEADTENIRKGVSENLEPEEAEVPEPCESKLKKKWLEESIQKLRSVGSQASPQNVQEWLQASIATCKVKGSQESKQNLRQWLETMKQNLQEECPEASRQDVKEWLEVSLRNIQEEDPDTTTLNVKEWLEKSLKSIQDFHPQTSKENVPEDLEQSSFQVPRDHLRKGWLEASIENLRRGGSEASRQNMQKGLQAIMSRLSKMVPEASKQDLQGWLETSIKHLQEECPEASRKDMKEWLEVSKSYLTEKGPETSKLSVQEWLEASIRSIWDLQEKGLERSTQKMEDLPKHHEQASLKLSELPKDHLSKNWLEASIQNIKKGGTEASRQNVHSWLQASMAKLSKSPETFKQNLEEWLEASVKNLPEECPETSRKDVKEWVGVSMSYLQKKKPEISKLNIEEWLHESMRGIQEQRGPEVYRQTLHPSDHEASTVNVCESFETTNLLRQSLETPHESVHEWYKSNLIEEGRSKASMQNAGELLQLSSKDHHRKATSMSMRDSSPTSERDYEEECLDKPSRSVAASLIKSVRNLQAESRKLSTLWEKDWLEEFVQSDRKEASRLNVQKWLESSARSLQAAGREASKQNVQEWLVESMRNLDEECPEESRHDVQEWLQASLKKLQGSEASRYNAREWIGASLKSLKEEAPEIPVRDVEEWLAASVKSLKEEAYQLSVQDWLEASLAKLQEEDPEASRDDVKEWLQSSLKKFKTVTPETSRQDVKQWLEGSLRNLQTPKQSLQKYLKESLMNIKAASVAASKSRQTIRDVEECLAASVKSLKEEASRQQVQEWLEGSLAKLQEEDPESTRNDVKEWLQSSLKKLKTLSPETSRQDVKQWLEGSLRNLRTPKQSLQKYLKESLMNIKAASVAASKSRQTIRDVEECLAASVKSLKEEASRQRVQEWLEGSLSKLQEEDPESTRDDVKEWLQSSLKKLKTLSPEMSRQDVKQWLEGSLRNLSAPKQSLQKYLKESLRNIKSASLAASRSRETLQDMEEWLAVSIKGLKEEARRQSVQEWLEASLATLQEEDPESSRDDVKEWLESSLKEFKAVSSEKSKQDVKQWLEQSLSHLRAPKQNLQEFVKESLMHIQAASLAASQSRLTVDPLKESKSSTGSKGILKCLSSKAYFDRRSVSRTSLTPEDNDADLEREEDSEISQVSSSLEAPKGILKQRWTKRKWLYDHVGPNTKVFIAKLSDIYFWYRNPLEYLFKIFLSIVVPVVLTALAYRHYKQHCLFRRGLRPH